MIPVDAALDIVLKHTPSLGAEEVPLTEALGRVLVEDVSTDSDLPPFDRSAMDGYAVRAADVATVPARLRLVGEVAAGHPFEGTVGAGEAARIFTGAPLPQGADAVVMQEDVAVEGDEIAINEAVVAGENIRRAGTDLCRGQRIFAAGEKSRGRDRTMAPRSPAAPPGRASLKAWSGFDRSIDPPEVPVVRWVHMKCQTT